MAAGNVSPNSSRWRIPSAAGFRYFVRREGMQVAAELRNIQEAAQLASLFALPAGYQIYAPRKPQTRYSAPHTGSHLHL